EQLEALEEEKFDVLVIGGGCVGSGVALDAATRGLKVAVVERDDFAAGTSGRSTKLIHGGVRYLENAFKNLDWSQYLLVREALAERSHMLEAAGYLAKPLAIMLPIEQWWKVPYYYAGTKVYDLVAGAHTGVPRSMFLSKEQAMYSYPLLDASNLSGAIVYYDGQMNDTRFSLMVLLTAVQSGAVAANHVNVEQLVKRPDDGKIVGAVVKDRVSNKTFTVRAKTVINATGPFTDSLRRMARDPDGKDPGPSEENQADDLVVPGLGIHLVLPDHFSPNEMGLIVPDTSDGRVLFFLPWSGGTLCGTTDSKGPISMLPKPSSDEVDFVLRESGRYLNRRISRADVRAAWSGVRPLVRDPKSKDTKAISREHITEVNDGGMVTSAGGKWTTYRQMAEDALDMAIKINPSLQLRSGPCVTKGLKLIGADRAGIVCEQKFNVITVTLREDYGYDRDIAEHLTSNYGTRALQIAEIVKHGYPTRPKNLHPKRLVAKHPFLEAEVVFAVQHEYARTPIDVLARRTRLAFVDHAAALEALPLVVNLMATLLNWNRATKQQQTQDALEFLNTMKCPARDEP
ncbi:Glycerol-3-phosphate dehydrogenase, partial [Durusdinium trenchii]